VYSESETKFSNNFHRIYASYLSSKCEIAGPARPGRAWAGGESGRQAGEAAGDRCTTGVSGAWARGEGDEVAGERDKDQR
jgi:hypothetical protein